jgi:AhpC/TSA family
MFWRSAGSLPPLVVAALAIVLLAGCHEGGGAASAEPAASSVSRAVIATDWDPAFVDILGKEHRPSTDPSTKAIVLVFILADCPIANSYMPELNRLHEAFSTRGVCLLLVQADARITVEQAREHAEQYQVQVPVILDRRHAWVSKAGATKTPEAVVFSAAGDILYRGRIDDQFAGLGKRRANVTSHDLGEALDAILAGRPVRQPRTEVVGCLIPENSGGE